MTEITCETCNDTHSMSLRGSLVPCTRCPTPCQECRINGRGAYCATTPCACACHSIVDRPAPTATPALDLDAAEKRADGFRGRFRVMAYDSGDELLEFVALDAYNCDESEIDGGDVDEIAQFACDDETQRAIVDTLNAAPALIAEVRTLRAQVCRLLAGRGIESDYMCQHLDADRAALDEVRALRAKLVKARAEITHLTAELAAARAVPAEVEDAIAAVGLAAFEAGAPSPTLQAAERHLRTAIARAISDATAAPSTVGGLLATAPRPQCPTHGDTVNCYCTTGALHCHDCGHTPPFCTACDGYHDAGPCPLPKGG